MQPDPPVEKIGGYTVDDGEKVRKVPDTAVGPDLIAEIDRQYQTLNPGLECPWSKRKRSPPAASIARQRADVG